MITILGQKSIRSGTEELLIGAIETQESVRKMSIKLWADE